MFGLVDVEPSKRSAIRKEMHKKFGVRAGNALMGAGYESPNQVRKAIKNKDVTKSKRPPCLGLSGFSIVCEALKVSEDINEGYANGCISYLERFGYIVLPPQ